MERTKIPNLRNSSKGEFEPEQPITKGRTDKTAPPKKTAAIALIPSHCKTKAKDPSVGAAPCVTPNDTASTELTAQDSHCTLTTKYGDFSVDREVAQLMNVDQSGRLRRYPAIVLKRLSTHMITSQRCQNRRMTRPTRLRAYLCDGDSDSSDDSNASAYVPSDGSLSSCETPKKYKLGSDFSDTSSTDSNDYCSSFEDVSDRPST